MLRIIPFTLALIQITRHTVYATDSWSGWDEGDHSWVTPYFRSGSGDLPDACTPEPQGELVEDQLPSKWRGGTKATNKHDSETDSDSDTSRSNTHISPAPQPLKSPTGKRKIDKTPTPETQPRKQRCLSKSPHGIPMKSVIPPMTDIALQRQRTQAKRKRTYGNQKDRVKMLESEMQTNLKGVVAKVETEIKEKTNKMNRLELLEFLSYFGLCSHVVRNHVTRPDLTEILAWLFEWAPKLLSHRQSSPPQTGQELQHEEPQAAIVAELTRACKSYADAQCYRARLLNPKVKFIKDSFVNRLVIACWKEGFRKFNKWIIFRFVEANGLISFEGGKGAHHHPTKDDIEPVLDASDKEFRKHMKERYGDNTKRGAT